MAINSKQKGARFEREIAQRFRDYGYNTIRAVQYCGANGDADILGTPKLHCELKHVEKLNIHEAMRQAERDSRSDEIPVVIHKKNYSPILVTMHFDDFMELYKEWERGL